MKNIYLLILIIIASIESFAQYSTGSGIFLAKEFSKEISLYKAKSFLIKEVLGPSNKTIKFEIFALAATNSGELTSLVYKCDDLKKEGLVLGFYGDTWNDQGLNYKAYAFKSLESEKAKLLLNSLDSLTSEYLKFINADYDNNNIYFHYEDITFLFYRSQAIGNAFIVRVFWNGFDSEWEWGAIAKTIKRLNKKLK